MGLTETIQKALGFGKSKKGAGQIFSPGYSSIFLNRLGQVNNYDDRQRTYIEKGYQDNPIVQSIVNQVAKNGGTVKWSLYKVAPDGTREVVDHPVLSRLLEQPNPDKSWTDLQQDVLVHKLLTGSAFIRAEKPENGLNAGLPNWLYIVPSEEMQIIPNVDRTGIAGYQVDFAWAGDNIIPAEEILHIKNPNPDFDETGNWLFGQSNLRAARHSINTYNESIQAGLGFLQNRGSQKLLINDNDEQELGPEGADALKKKLRAQSQGAQNVGNLPFIDAKLGILDVGSNPKELLVLEQRAQAGLEICNAMNFPAQLVGLKDATYQNAKEAKKALWENVILPELSELRQGYNRWLVPQFGDDTLYLDYDVSDVAALQEDLETKAKAVIGYANVCTVNEVREFLGKEPFDGAEGEAIYTGPNKPAPASSTTEKLDDWFKDTD